MRYGISRASQRDMDILPIVLWGIGVVVSVGVCVHALISGKYRNKHMEPDVTPPSMTTAIEHLVSVICFLTALIIATFNIDLYAQPMREFYRYAIPIGGGLAIVLLGLQIVLLYMQSRRAMRTEMNRRLSRHTR